jgi:hypothetical protein
MKQESSRTFITQAIEHVTEMCSNFVLLLQPLFQTHNKTWAEVTAHEVWLVTARQNKLMDNIRFEHKHRFMQLRAIVRATWGRCS